MITILDLARKCNCDPTTVRKWIKNHDIKTGKVRSTNGKLVQAIVESDAEKFDNYWKSSTFIPEDMVAVAEVASRNSVDRKTVRYWCDKNGVTLNLVASSSGPPMHIMKISDGNRFDVEYSSNDKVPVSYFISEYNTDWRTIRRWVDKSGVQLFKLPSKTGGRTNFSLMTDDAKLLESYLVTMKSDGFFYLIQPVPELNPNRIKLGFTKKPSRRLREHKGVCPNATLVKKWACQKDEEPKVRALVTKKGCVQLFTEIDNKKTATEVFDCEDYQEILARLDEYFRSNNE